MANCPDREFVFSEANRRAADALSELLVRPGEHHVTVSVEILGESFTAQCAAHKPQGALHFDRQPTELVFALVAAALAGGTGGLICRTSDPADAPTPDRPCAVYGWAIFDSTLIPLTSAQIFNAECVDNVTGEPIPPEHAVTYIDAPELPGGRPG